MATKTLRPSFVRKIVDLDTLTRHREMARRAGKTLVHCHGCFDIVHPGHIRYLQFAKQQGDYLVVTLTGDPHVGKGESRPYIPQELRAENLAALEFVDWVYVNPDPTATELLAALKPDVYIKGREYEHNVHPGFLKEKATVEAYGGRVIFSSGDVVYSSSHIIENYAQRLDLETEKLQLFCKRYDITRDSLTAFMDQIVDRPYVVIGDTILDRYQYCDATDLANDGPMMSLVPLEKRDYLGGAAMIARHLAGLGAEVTLIASLGQDDASDAAIDSLEASGIHVLAMRNRKKLATKTRFVVDAQKLFLVDESPSTPTDSTNEKWLSEEITRLTAETGTTLLVYDAGLGVFTDALWPPPSPPSAEKQNYHPPHSSPAPPAAAAASPASPPPTSPSPTNAASAPPPATTNKASPHSPTASSATPATRPSSCPWAKKASSPSTPAKTSNPAEAGKENSAPNTSPALSTAASTA